jgi:hypothetical protein
MKSYLPSQVYVKFLTSFSSCSSLRPCGVVTTEVLIRNYFELVGALVCAYGPVDSTRRTTVLKANEIFKAGAEATRHGIFYYHEHRGSAFAQETMRPLRSLPEEQAVGIWKE